MTTAGNLAAELPIGINTFVWHSPLNDTRLATTVEAISRWGYDGIELALENPNDWNPDHAGDLLAEAGLKSVVGAVFSTGRELTAASSDTVATTQQYLRVALDVAQRQGSSLVIGPMYTSVGRAWRCTPDERATFISDLRESLAPICEEAAACGIPLAIEPLNRYETSLLNTAEQVMELIDPLPVEGIGVNLDTYHMNIEEKSMGGALRAVGDRLLHLQVCGNDRGAPGADHIDWTEIRTSLQDIDYRGMLGFESFTADNASIATAASIWRPLAVSQDELAITSLRFLQQWRGQWRDHQGRP